MVGRDQRIIVGDRYAQSVPCFEQGQRFALLVEEVQAHGRGHVQGDRAGAMAEALLLDPAQDRQRRRFRGAAHTDALAIRTGLEAGFEQAGPQPLPRQFQQAEGTNAPQLDAGAVVFHRFLEPSFDLGLIAGDFHVDEIDDDQSREVSQAQLASNLIGCLQIGAERGLLDVPFAGGAAGVDVDGDERLGGIDDDIAARLQVDQRDMHGIQLILDLVILEQ